MSLFGDSFNNVFGISSFSDVLATFWSLSKSGVLVMGWWGKRRKD